MNSILAQSDVANETLVETQPLRDLAEIEICLVGGGEVIYVGN